MNITHTVSLVELIWTVISLAGLYFTYRPLRRAYLAQVWVEEHEPVEEAAQLNLVTRLKLARSAAFVFVMLGNLLVGLVAMAQAPVVQHVTATQAAISIVFVLEVVVISAVSAYVDYLEGVLLRKLGGMNGD